VPCRIHLATISSQRDGGSSSAASTSRVNDPSSLRSGTDSDEDSMIDFEQRRPNKKKRYVLFPDRTLNYTAF
jgi:hypothetical protein